MLLLNLSSTCFAIDLDELRWVKVYETDTDKCYIDTESVNFDDNLKRIFKCNKKHRYVSVWFYDYSLEFVEYRYMLSFVHWDLDCKKYKFDEILAYREDDTLYDKEDYSGTKPSRVIPNSLAEQRFKAVECLYNIEKISKKIK